MVKQQSIILINFDKLFIILNEIKHLLKFNILNYKNSKDIEKELEKDNQSILDTIIVTQNEKNILFKNKKIDENNILIINDLPLKIEKIIEKINIKLIKQKYNSQSNLNIKDYFLDLNSRIISKNEIKLKLTEREIDIILFLNESNLPRSVEQFQNDVWGYSSGLETHTVETHIYRLRKKISNTFDDEAFIISVDNGYKI
tara:strand:- start:359 stop:958 length:600 start_codon:yes stop_codon:yes gene_type:complete